MAVLKGIDVIRRWVIQTRLKEQTKEGGVMITLPKKEFVDLNTSITADRLLRSGIDIDQLTNINQVENIINQINKPKVISQGSPEFTGIMSRMTGKNVIKGDFGPGFKKEIEKMSGDLPPPGSRGGADDIAAPVQSAEESTTNLTNSTIENMLKMEPIDAMKEANKVIKREGIYKALNKKQAKKILEDTEDHIFERDFKTPDDPDFDPESMADGGRIGYKKGSVDLARRGFMKAAAGVGAGIGALKMGALKLFGKEGTRQVTKNIIKTDPVPGKPEWFDALVTKVINQGEEVTKRYATQEREIVHKLDIDKFEDVTVYRNMDTGEIRVSYVSPTNVGEDSVDLVYKKPLPDEGDPRPSAEFYAVEPEPRVVNRDGDMEMDGENLVNNVDELMSDTSKLKIIAKGDAKPTLKEFVTSKRKKDAVKSLNESPIEQAEYIEAKYGPGPEPDFDDIENFASGGIARMLGE